MQEDFQRQSTIQTQAYSRLEAEMEKNREDKQKISQILHNVIKDRDTTRSEVQTLSEQLKKALATIGELIGELQNTRVRMEELQSQPQSQATTPSFSFTPQSLPVILEEQPQWDEMSPWQFSSNVQMTSPSFARTGTLQFAPQNDVENDTMDVQERMNRYLDDQSSISGSAASTLDLGTHGDRVFDSLSGFHSVSR